MIQNLFKQLNIQTLPRRSSDWRRGGEGRGGGNSMDLDLETKAVSVQAYAMAIGLLAHLWEKLEVLQ